MNNIQKQIDKSVEEFDKGFEKLIRLRFTSYDFDRMKDKHKQSQLDLIEVIKKDVDKMQIISTDDKQFKLHTDGYNNALEDVLDLLNNLK